MKIINFKPTFKSGDFVMSNNISSVNSVNSVNSNEVTMTVKEQLSAVRSKLSIDELSEIDNNEYEVNESMDVKFESEDDEFKSLVLTFPTYHNLNSNNTLVVKFNYEKKLVKFHGRTYRVNEYLLKVKKVRKDSVEEYQVVECSVSECLDILVSTVQSYKKGKANVALKFLNELVGRVLRTDWEINEDNTIYNLAAIQPETEWSVDRQQVLRDNKVVSFHVNNSGLMLSGKKYGWVEECIEVANEVWGFAISDKNNNKYAYVGDAVLVCGVSADGTKTIVADSKVAKTLNRLTMLNEIGAEFEVIYEDALSTLLDNGKLAKAYGVGKKVLLVNDPLMSINTNDAGIIARSPFSYKVNKRLEDAVNIDTLLSLDVEYCVEVKTACKTSKEEIEYILKDVQASLDALEGKVLAPQEYVSFRGIKELTLVHNPCLFPITIVNAHSFLGSFINTECRSIEIVTKGKAIVEADYNVKLRGSWIKGMTARCDAYSLINEPDIDLIINHNSVKNQRGVAIRAWANAYGVQVAFTSEGKLVIIEEDENGKPSIVADLDYAEVEAGIKQLTKTYQVSNVISKEAYETFKEDVEYELSIGRISEDCFANVHVKEINSELVELTYSVEAFQCALVQSVELSSVVENASLNRTLAPERASFLATFAENENNNVSKGAEDKLAINAARVAKDLREANAKLYEKEFNLDNAEELKAFREVLSLYSRCNNRDLLVNLGNKFGKYGAFKLRGSVNGKRAWNIVIPAKLLANKSHFRKADGNSTDPFVSSVCAMLHLIYRSVETEVNYLNSLANYAMDLKFALQTWLEDVDKSKNSFTRKAKAFDCHGFKVVSASAVKDDSENFVSSYERVNGKVIPILWMNRDNPLAIKGTKDRYGNKVKCVAHGDYGFVYRNPMLDMQPVIVKFNDSVCGKYVVAMDAAALAISSQTDTDGDQLFFVPAKQVGVGSSVGKYAEDAAATVAKWLDHPLVGKEISLETLRAFKAESVLASFIDKKDNFSVGLDKTIGDLSPFSLLTTAQAVGNHYQRRVGQTYSMTFNAFSSFTAKYLANKKNPSVFTKTELIAIKASSFVFYEGLGLSGYSFHNEKKLEHLDAIAKSLLGKAKGVSRGLFTVAASSAGASFNVWQEVAKYRAQGMLQSKHDFNEEALGNPVLANTELHKQAIANAHLRSLSKGAYNFHGTKLNSIFNYHVELNTSHPMHPIVAAWCAFVRKGMVSK